MAQADHLPIFKACYDLCLYLEQVVERFSRSHRFGLGSEMRASARRALEALGRRRDFAPRACHMLASVACGRSGGRTDPAKSVIA